jgi:DNA-binding response OmpR family regulator
MRGSAKTVLIVEDDPKSLDLVRLAATVQNHILLEAMTGSEGLRIARDEHPNLIIIDIMSPGMSGLDVCRRLRSEGSSAPIILLAAKDAVRDVVVGLELGADDCIVKPFELRELMARIAARLRRVEISAQAPLRDRLGLPG